MEQAPKIKILVGYHKPATLLKNEILTPIHLGRTLACEASKDGVMSQADYQWMLGNMIGDDTGDNISKLNRYLCEMSGIYWAWKNYDKLGNPDYIGFMHYRRHLCFNLKNPDIQNISSEILYYKQLDNEYIKKNSLDTQSIQDIVSKYDIVVREKYDLEENTCYTHYKIAKPFHHIKDYDKVIQILLKKQPEYKKAVDKYNSSRYAYFTNIFIMKKDLFEKYANWIFPIIFEAQKQIDISFYSLAESRQLAYISEWLFGIWYTHLKMTQEIHALELKSTLAEDTDLDLTCNPKPAFAHNNIAVCLATDENYINYLGVAIQSIMDNATAKNNYDINVLYEKLPIEEQQKILELKKQENISIRFFKVTKYYNNLLDIFFTKGHFTKAVYNRFFISDIFKEYSKVLYLDADIVVNKDIADLYATPLDSKYLLAACHDYEIIYQLKSPQNFDTSYYTQFLNLKNAFNYFQSGVLLFNIKQFRKENILNKLLSQLQETKTPKFVDQDILNIVCEDRVLYLDAKWNVEYHIPFNRSDWKEKLPVDYEISRQNPWILHYSSGRKPWIDARFKLSKYFWQYARQTPFYEEIIYSNLKKPAAPNDNTKELLRDVLNYSKIRFNYYRCRLLANLTLGGGKATL